VSVHRNGVVLIRENHPDHPRHGFIVIDYQDMPVAGGPSGGFSMHGQADGDSRALADLAGHRDPAAVSFQ